MKLFTVLAVSAFALNAFSAEHRAKIGAEAKKSEKKAMMAAGGFGGLPMAGQKKKVDEAKAEEKNQEKK